VQPRQGRKGRPAREGREGYDPVNLPRRSRCSFSVAVAGDIVKGCKIFAEIGGFFQIGQKFSEKKKSSED
jgi:hypothetical protein